MFSRQILNEAFEKHGLMYLGSVALQADDKRNQRFEQWIKDGYHGEMKFMENYPTSPSS